MRPVTTVVGSGRTHGEVGDTRTMTGALRSTKVTSCPFQGGNGLRLTRPTQFHPAHTSRNPARAQTEEGKGRTALYLASGRGHAEVVKLLLRRGADPCIKRKGGWCPLSVAASEAHVGVVRILLSQRRVDVDSRCVTCLGRKGKDPGLKSDPTSCQTFNGSDNDGSTALYRASLWGCTEAVRELLRRGADPTILGGGGLTPVAVARARGYRACIEALEVRSNL